MRLRNIPNANIKLAQNERDFVANPADFKGRWHELFKNNNPIHIEIGMGKGQFLTQLALQNPDINYIGIEKFSSVLLRASEKLETIELNNVKIINIDALMLNEYFDTNEVARIYLNFSDPWPKKRQNKRRLTYPTCLKEYFRVLKPGGKVIFKTDNDVLFEDSLGYFDESDFSVVSVTHDYQLEEGDQMTEYEKKFRALGTKIKRLVAVKDR